MTTTFADDRVEPIREHCRAVQSARVSTPPEVVIDLPIM
jgi:hypothetical protein